MSQNNKYAEVMRRLVSRYIHQTKKQHRQDGVNEDDLLEIKQDISSLRYTVLLSIRFRKDLLGGK